MNERMNIRRMQVPESEERTFRFDPDRELTTTDWDNIRELVIRNHDTGAWDEFAKNYEALCVMGHQNDYEIFEPDWEGIENRRYSLERLGNTAGAIRLASLMKGIDPARVRPFTESQWKMALETAEQLRAGARESWGNYSYISLVHDLNQINPGRAVIDSYVWAVIEKRYAEIREVRDRLLLTSLSATVLDMDPSKVPEISTSEWEEIRRDLAKVIKKEVWSRAITLARDMTVIVRHEAKRAKKRSGEASPVPQSVEL
jgi:hypothetical protein